jgi:glycosyltransferase involved in cell wall biosynthesis
MNKSISAFFPVLNEEGAVAKLTLELLHVLKREFETSEVIIVNDGSTDRTGQIADELKASHDGYLRVIHHERNRGYGNALKAGFEASQHDLIFFTDGDHQFDMNDLDKVLPFIEDHDIVVGYRQNRQDSRLRLFLARGYNRLIRLLFGLKLRDIDCSFKLFTRGALDQIDIESHGYFIDTEIMVKAKKLGLRIKEVGVRHLPRTSGESKVRMRHIFVTLREISKLWSRLR